MVNKPIQTKVHLIKINYQLKITKQMKNLKIIVASLALILATQMTFAQQKRANCADKPDRAPRQERLEQRLDKFAAEANLTEAQKTEMKRIHKAHFEAVKAKREQQRAEMDAMRQDFEAQVAQVLDEKQLEQFKALKKDRPKRGKRGDGQRPQEPMQRRNNR